MSIISTTCQFISSFFECVEISRTISEIPQAATSNEKLKLISHAALSALAVVCNTATLGGKAFGTKTTTLQPIKGIELLARGLDGTTLTARALYDIASEVGYGGETISLRHIISLVERGIILPFAAFARTSAEVETLREKAYLELSPEEFARTKRTIYKTDCDGNFSISKYKPLDREECLKNLKESSSFAEGAKVWEAASHAGFLTTLSIGVESRCKKLAELLARREQPLAPGAPHRAPLLLDPEFLTTLQSPTAVAAQPVQVVQAPPENAFDLLGSSSIPEALHNDVVLSAHVCPISQEPIRHPVGDPNGITIYERDYILRVIQEQHRSPVTHAPLSQEQLIQRPDLQAVIDNRLRTYQEAFQTVINTRQNQPNQAG